MAIKQLRGHQCILPVPLFVDSVRNTLFLDCEVVCAAWWYRARQKWQWVAAAEREPCRGAAGGVASLSFVGDVNMHVGEDTYR